jgi:hypothetical protein
MNNYMISVMIVPALLSAVPIYLVNAAEKCERTTLYPFTLHPTAEHVVLCHPIGKSLVDANNANLLFNQGIIAGQHSVLTKCPGNNKNFCEGWNYVKNPLGSK